MKFLGHFGLRDLGSFHESTIDELKSVVNDFARDMDSPMISKAESMQVCSC